MADATLPPVGEIATTMIRTGTVPVDLTGMTEIDLPEVRTITPPHGTGMMIRDDGETTENEMRG